MRPDTFRLALVTALIASSPVQAKSEAVRFEGCVSPGVEHGCLIVRSGAEAYNITSAQPRPDPKRRLAIRGSGVLAGGMSYCMQGKILKNIRWSYTRTSCPFSASSTNGQRRP